MNSEFLMLPHFDPTIFTFGDSNIGLRWYGLMYLLGFIFARWLAVARAKRSNGDWNTFVVPINLIVVGLWIKWIRYFLMALWAYS